MGGPQGQPFQASPPAGLLPRRIDAAAPGIMIAALKEKALPRPRQDHVDVAVVAVAAGAVDESAIARETRDIGSKDSAVIVVQSAAQELQIACFAVDIDAYLVAIRLDIDSEAGRVAAMRSGIAVPAELAVNRREAQYVQRRESAPGIVPTTYVDHSDVAAHASRKNPRKGVVVTDVNAIGEAVVKVQVSQLDILASVERDEMRITFMDGVVAGGVTSAAVHLEALDEDVSAAPNIERHEVDRVDTLPQPVRARPARSMEAAVEQDASTLAAKGQTIQSIQRGVANDVGANGAVGQRPILLDEIFARREHEIAAAAAVREVGEPVESRVIVGPSIGNEAELPDHVHRSVLSNVSAGRTLEYGQCAECRTFEEGSPSHDPGSGVPSFDEC